MTTSSTIMDSNSFKPEDMADLDERTRRLAERRAVLGPSYRLFYHHPLNLVRGKGTRLFDADGTEYLDAYNNIPSLGHSHPAVQEAVSRQLGLINTHTRYLHETILDYAEDLLSTMPGELDRVMFLLSGSEANDLAVRIAKAYTGGTGIIVTSEAYHGNTELITKLSPSIGHEQPMAIDMRMIPTPDTYRLRTEDLGTWMAEHVRKQAADMRRHGIAFAGLLIDDIFSSDGVFPGKPGFLKPVVEAVHELGGVYIADEVQPGFTRTGTFWGFERHDVVPDIVTMGKPMANGIACSAVAAREKVLEAFAQSSPYFNTFAGSPVAMAAAQATLDALRAEDTMGNARRVGGILADELRALAQEFPQIGDVRGAGLFIGADVVAPGTTDPDYPAAVRLIEGMRERHVLTSLCGPFGNVLKIRPPLVFDESDVDWFMSALRDTLKNG
ncbi:aspartate aminotransferase family protein [Gordonibacter sp. 28C]|uniref:aspartate aminotransferase family protein n=1 Tax=Gordonibacter sp. 28C TaxID=2078569 RepID=UPI000DF7FB52|nr:aspartate aminotransferase family protein [Gordonibacter sp. 28C]RDB61366.1 aspartate aminotransferase family protein [Gordonibacter sp. 28C]